MCFLHKALLGSQVLVQEEFCLDPPIFLLCYTFELELMKYGLLSLLCVVFFGWESSILEQQRR